MSGLAAIEMLAGQSGLMVAGVAKEGDDLIVLVSPDEPAFWTALQSAAEWQDGAPDPIDRWSKRVIGGIAATVGGIAVFPSDGPPYPPFFAWATATGRIWQSPVTLLVHEVAGLFISFRGAIRLAGQTAQPSHGARPCDSCAGQPCLSACPAHALTSSGYEVARCHDWLDRPEGADCIAQGCRVRRACPIGQDRRDPAQSAYHMRVFHP